MDPCLRRDDVVSVYKKAWIPRFARDDDRVHIDQHLLMIKDILPLTRSDAATSPLAGEMKIMHFYELTLIKPHKELEIDIKLG